MMGALQRTGSVVIAFLVGWVSNGWFSMRDSMTHLPIARPEVTTMATCLPLSTLVPASNAGIAQLPHDARQAGVVANASPKPQMVHDVTTTTAQDAWLVIGTQFLVTTNANLKARLHQWVDEAPSAPRYHVAQQALNAPAASDRKSAYLWLTNLPADVAEPARQMRLAALQTETDAEALRTLIGALATETDELTEKQKSAVVRRLQELARLNHAELAADSFSHLIRLDTGPATVSLVVTGLQQDADNAQQLRILKALSQTNLLPPAFDAMVRAIAEDGSRPKEIRSLANQLLKENQCS